MMALVPIMVIEIDHEHWNACQDGIDTFEKGLTKASLRELKKPSGAERQTFVQKIKA